MAVENYVRIDGPPLTLSVLRSKSFCPKVWFGLEPFEKAFVLTRNGDFCAARFRSNEIPVTFYKKLQLQYPDIRITYEYLTSKAGSAHSSSSAGTEYLTSKAGSAHSSSSAGTEYLSPQVAAHGSVPGPETKHYYFSPQDLIPLRSIRQWKLTLEADSQPLIAEGPTVTFSTDESSYDYEGDYIMKLDQSVCCT